MKTFCLTGFLLLLLVCSAIPASADTGRYRCQPTAEGEIEPFYRPGAPLQSKIGTFYLLTGTDKSALDFRPPPSHRVELLQTTPNGHYDDDHRAANITDASGQDRFKTNAAQAYLTRLPHSHIRVSANGYQTLVTPHYLQPGINKANLGLILLPEIT